jgi:hypothetical protein
MKASARTRLFSLSLSLSLFDNSIGYYQCTNVLSFPLRLIHLFLMFSVHKLHSRKEEHSIDSKCERILDISAIEQATCDNIQRLFEFIHTLFFFHLFLFFYFSSLILHTYVLSLIVLHKQTMHCIYVCSSLYTDGSILLYILSLFFFFFIGKGYRDVGFT